MVSFDHVSKRYGESLVLDDVTFSIKPCEFIFLVGKSGAGKTTLMRLLTYQTQADAGEIIVNDLHLHRLGHKDIQALRRSIGVIYQDYKLLPERTVAENIALGLEIIGKSREETEARVIDLLALIQLPEKANVFPSQLSGGEAQRVCIARALATAPHMLFADEPTGNLDDVTALSIVKLLGKINELGTTVIMATHNMSLVDRMHKRVIAIRAGKIEEIQSEGENKKLTEKHIGEHKKQSTQEKEE